MGDIAVRFRVESAKSWINLIGLTDIDDEALESTIHIDNSGLKMLLAPRDVTAQQIDETAFINQIIRGLQQRYQYIIIDTDSRLNEMTRGICSIADQILLLSDLDLASLKNLKVRIKELISLDVKESAISLIINKSDLKVGISPHDIPELIGMGVSNYLPWDIDVTRYANEGLVIVTEKERSEISHKFLHLTDYLLEQLENSQTHKPKPRSKKSA